MQIAQDKQPADQSKEAKRIVPGETGPPWPEATTVGPWWQPRPARGGCHGRGGPSHSRFASVFLQRFGFPRDAFSVAACVWL